MTTTDPPHRSPAAPAHGQGAQVPVGKRLGVGGLGDVEPERRPHGLELQTGDAPVDQLPKLVATIHEEIRQIRIVEDPDERPMAGAGAHLVRWEPQLTHRLKLAAVLLQADYDPRIRDADTRALQKAIDAGKPVFNASGGLFSGVLTGDTYLGPLLGARSPIVWGFATHRALGVVVYSFGQPLAGTTGNAAELLQTLPCQSRPEPRPVPTVPERAAASALDWWTTRLDALFGVITDPAVATDNAGVFRPAKQIHALLSVEQLFRRVGSLQTTERDANARRVLLFTVLDTLDRLTGRSIEKLCSVRFARERLEALRATIPSDGAAILLPGAERAVEALEQLQHGFFLTRQLATATVPVPDADGSQRHLDLDSAAAEYLKVLRDATHGHGTNKKARVAITDALLGQHDGEIPLHHAARSDRCPVNALSTWLQAAAITDGPVLRKISKGNRVQPRALHPESVNALVQQAIARAGITGGPYSAHSLRAGFVTYAHLRGATDRAIAHQTRHRSLATIGAYVRVESAWQDNAATQLGL